MSPEGNEYAEKADVDPSWLRQSARQSSAPGFTTATRSTPNRSRHANTTPSDGSGRITSSVMPRAANTVLIAATTKVGSRLARASVSKLACDGPSGYSAGSNGVSDTGVYRSNLLRREAEAEGFCDADERAQSRVAAG